MAESGNAPPVDAQPPYTNIQAPIEAARKAPGTINYGTSGNGPTLHLAGALFAQQVGVKLTYIPYKGNSQAPTDVAGQIDQELTRWEQNVKTLGITWDEV